ncbi:MAG: hypothetical protein M1814_002493 [Vezdaea aestivalis]|nr:MAG: hypothetical protein M1814_002493 [Vezdaea aestivalis]
MASSTPIEDLMRSRIAEKLKPTTLDIHNDSHLHAHHAAMEGSQSKETHFRIVVTSDAFRGKLQAMRHRMIYGLLKDEMARDGGIHAIQMKTQTPEEEARTKELEKTDVGQIVSEIEEKSV